MRFGSLASVAVTNRGDRGQYHLCLKDSRWSNMTGSDTSGAKNPMNRVTTSDLIATFPDVGFQLLGIPFDGQDDRPLAGTILASHHRLDQMPAVFQRQADLE